MKKSAKLLALVLALALVLTAFAGCGGTGTSGSAAPPASTSGSGTAAGPENQVSFVPGDSLFAPAGTGKVTLTGPCTVVKTTVPAGE